MWLTWPKEYRNQREKDFANASDYLETWDDSDSITAVNAQKRLETFTKNGGITTQKHNIKVSRSTVNILLISKP